MRDQIFNAELVLPGTSVLYIRCYNTSHNAELIRVVHVTGAYHIAFDVQYSYSSYSVQAASDLCEILNALHDKLETSPISGDWSQARTQWR